LFSPLATVQDPAVAALPICGLTVSRIG